MAKLLKHYLVDRDNPSIFATTPEQFTKPLFGTMSPNIQGLNIVCTLFDGNGIQYFLSTCPDEVAIKEVEGLKIITQKEWDAEIAAYDVRQTNKRLQYTQTYANQLLNQTDWVVIKSLETNSKLSNDFVSWRQSLRNLTSTKTVPNELPAAPTGIVVDKEIYNSYIKDLRNIPMINDPLPKI